ncbi:MAG: four helix bundle protein [Microgenomates group bacterium]
MKKYIKYNFENLEIYQLANDLVIEIYKISNRFPKEELFGLTSQLKRAVVSIVLNIVEGSGRGSKKDFARFINQAIGSLLEVKATLILAIKLKYLPESTAKRLFSPIDKLFFKLTAFKKSLKDV